MVLHLLAPGAEPIAAYHRLYLLRNSTNQLVLKRLYYRFLESNGQCRPGGLMDATPISTCKYDAWLRSRLIEPHNCTFYYLRRGVEGLDVCDPYIVIRNHRSLTSLDPGVKIRKTIVSAGLKYVVSRLQHLGKIH